MTRLTTVSEEMRAKLEKVDEPESVCATEGTVLGPFTPATPLKLTFPPRITQEEIDQRIASQPGRRIKDIFSGKGE